LTLAEALSAHARALRTGGLDGIPNIDLVESAIARPYNGYHRQIAEKAAALVQSMAGNHGFADGNKRTTIILTHLLLSKSGYQLIPIGTDGSLDVAMERLVLATVRHELNFGQIVRWFEDRLLRM
jgi:death on curing protein